MPRLQRNLVIMLAHGLRADVFEDRRCWPLATPHFQKLCDRGIRLDATSACPADPGGMISVLTGLYPRQHGWAQQAPTPTRNFSPKKTGAALGPTQSRVHCDGWVAALREAGYLVAGVGCVGLIEPWLHEAVLVEDVDCLQALPTCAYLTASREKGLTAALLQQRRRRLKAGPFDPDRLIIEAGDDIDGFITEQACGMLTKMPTDRRWALIVMFSGPGNLLPPPTLYEGLVDAAVLTDGFAPVDLRQVNDQVELDYPRSVFQRLDAHAVGRFRSDYLGRVSLIDHAVGRVSSSIGGRSDADRTWTVLASDRGMILGEKGVVGHRSFIDASIQTPVVIVPSGGLSRPGKVGSERLASTVDVAATIAGIAGCDLPEAVAGRSLLSEVGPEPATVFRGSCLSEFGGRTMLRTPRHKAVFDTRTLELIGLYDLETDADEKSNLVSTPVGKPLVREMLAELGIVLMPLRALPTWASE